ncbi:MAG TPA: hypothetical protein VI749_09230 [Candidatus Omnitrophota bacterium]|nr:hypothetical protein [Candidatus Omnitrophota bacterium]
MREATEFIVIRDGEDYIRNVIVRDHTIQYVYGLSDKTASKQDLRKSYYYNSNPLLLKIEGDKNRFEKIGTEILGGKTCELLQNKDESFKEQICVWNNIVIKTVWEDSSFNFSIIAVSIDENVTIDESKFRVPDDYEIYDHEKTMEEFKKK